MQNWRENEKDQRDVILTDKCEKKIYNKSREYSKASKR